MEEDLKSRFWAVGGGKGGVGKSITTLLLGAMLARRGKKSILVDADLGGSNLHTLLGIKYPEYTLVDFIEQRVEDLRSIVMSTPIDNLMLICGADDILGIANPRYTQKARLFNHLERLEADYILLDLGSGTSFTTIDFFLYAPNKMIVVSPQITSIQNAYGFIKSSLYRKLSQEFSTDPECLEFVKKGIKLEETERIGSIDELKDAFWLIGKNKYERLSSCLERFKGDIVINMIRNSAEAHVADVIQSVAHSYLSINLGSLGCVNYDPMLEKNINDMSAFLTKFHTSTISSSFYEMASRMIKIGNQDYSQLLPVGG